MKHAVRVIFLALLTTAPSAVVGDTEAVKRVGGVQKVDVRAAGSKVRVKRADGRTLDPASCSTTSPAVRKSCPGTLFAVLPTRSSSWCSTVSDLLRSPVSRKSECTLISGKETVRPATTTLVVQRSGLGVVAQVNRGFVRARNCVGLKTRGGPGSPGEPRPPRSRSR